MKPKYFARRSALDVSRAIPYFDDLFFCFRVQRINLFLQDDGSLNGCHHAAVGFDLLQVKLPFSAILEPLRQHLVAADLVLPQLQRDGLEVLGFVDVDAFLFGFVAKAWLLVRATRLPPSPSKRAAGGSSSSDRRRCRSTRRLPSAARA